MITRIKWYVVSMFVMPFLITDRHLSRKSTDIFKLYISLYEPYNKDWRYRKSVNFCLYKGLPILILSALNGEYPFVKKEIDFSNLKSVIGMKDYRKWFFENYDKDWLRQKWYTDEKLPIICEIKNKLVVVDGNHRLAQQIYHNEIQYNYIKVNGGWFKLFINHVWRNK